MYYNFTTLSQKSQVYTQAPKHFLEIAATLCDINMELAAKHQQSVDNFVIFGKINYKK
jgi:hypothetical protein